MAQEQVVVSMLERFSAPAPGPDLAVQSPAAGASRSAKREAKSQTVTGT